MSESAGKTFRGLQEAYASMYSNNSDNLTEETIVSEVQEEQEFEINEELLYESLKKYLVSEGFVKTEKQALNMIPHISEEWMNSIVSHIYISECFHYCVDSLIEEGYDLSSYTEEDLFEAYCNSATENLNEALPFAIPGAAAAWPYIVGGVGALGTLWKSMNRKPTQPAGPSTWDYGQSGTSTYKPKPKPKPAAPVVKAQVTGDTGETERPRLRGTATRPPGSTETQPGPAASTPASSTPASSTPAPGGGGGGDNGDKKEPEPPKGPDWKKTFMDTLFKKGDKKPPSPLMQQAQQKAAELAGTVARRTAKGALGAGIGAIVDQGFLGGIGGKVARDVTRFGRGIGPGYEKLKREIKGEPETPKPAAPVAAKPAAPKQRKLKFGPNGSVIGFED